MYVFKFACIGRSEKLQAQLSADALIVSLNKCVIVLYLRHVRSEISHQFIRWSKIAKTVEIYSMIPPLCVCHPMSTWSCCVIQIHDAALVSIYTTDRQRITHENTFKEWYTHTFCLLQQLYIGGYALWHF